MSQNFPRRMNSSTTNLRFVSSIRDAIVELRCSTSEFMLGDPPDTLFIDGGAVVAKRPLVPRRAPSYGFSNVSPPFYPVLRCLLAYCNDTATRSGQSRTDQKYSTVNGIEIRLFMGISLTGKDRAGGWRRIPKPRVGGSNPSRRTPKSPANIWDASIHGLLLWYVSFGRSIKLSRKRSS